jgi:hypothetical protein
MEIVWTFIGNRMDFGFHNNCIFPWYGYSMEVVWIYYGFCGAIANFVVWISLFFRQCTSSRSPCKPIWAGYVIG